MNFNHSDERTMLADSLNRFLRENYTFEQRTISSGGSQGFDPEIWLRMAEIGTVSALFGEEAGGFGGQGFDISVVFESLGGSLVVEPFLGTLMVGWALAKAGGPSHRGLLESLVKGELIGAWAHEEPHQPSTVEHLATRAELQADGSWRLDGHKAVVQHAGAADLLLVSALTPEGLGLFLVPCSSGGLSMVPYPLIDGGHGAELVLDGVVVPQSAPLAGPDVAESVLEQAQGVGILALCAEAVGAMDAAKRQTLEYLGTRRQFGVPIGSFQALQHRMADLLIEIEQTRSAVINAAATLHGPRLKRERALSAAKYTVGRVGARVAEECIQLHGGMGMTRELPLAHFAKRLVMIDHQLGDEDFHLQRFAALSEDAVE
ncbi:Glutaryl-CoA dehydrogenase [Variovorax sp. PBS-H4]|uniref:acyl-CoA dehydrogenase n=1 Tax=Variovorax sp. PBS-H4 TaxID=434008 RepID=UPI001316FA49|nr:acyl-CoA dehydrogenase [Variovorax sp. PBS-H4]VTU36044.1 Glutaryl-CoA dehydrogenase [Variovorax sp. PBS-H4]